MADTDASVSESVVPESVETRKVWLGGGCFWCIEAVFRRQEGVLATMPGYAGGHQLNPDYYSVGSGNSGHAEVVEVEYDPARLALSAILDLFFRAHDPTTLNRQGADVGTQYRSIVLYQDNGDGDIARKALKKAAGLYKAPIVTEIEALDVFYAAEPEHHAYFERNPWAGYCRVVIRPKIDKLSLPSVPLF